MLSADVAALLANFFCAFAVQLAITFVFCSSNQTFAALLAKQPSLVSYLERGAAIKHANYVSARTTAGAGNELGSRYKGRSGNEAKLGR